MVIATPSCETHSLLLSEGPCGFGPGFQLRGSLISHNAEVRSILSWGALNSVFHVYSTARVCIVYFWTTSEGCGNMLHTRQYFWLFCQGHWKGEMAIIIRKEFPEVPAYRSVQWSLFARFQAVFERCRDVVTRVWGMDLSIRDWSDQFSEILRLLEQMDMAAYGAIETIITEFERQFSILSQLTADSDAGGEALLTFVGELPGNFRNLLRILSTRASVLEFSPKEGDYGDLWLTGGKYNVHVEETGAKPVSFLGVIG